MAEHQFSPREIELLFKRIDEKLDDIRQDIKDTNKHFDDRLRKVEIKVEKMENWHGKVMAVWGTIVFIIGLFANYLIGRFLP
jgi:Zn-dependent M32 family carboxypeptidase